MGFEKKLGKIAKAKPPTKTKGRVRN